MNIRALAPTTVLRSLTLGCWPAALHTSKLFGVAIVTLVSLIRVKGTLGLRHLPVASAVK